MHAQELYEYCPTTYLCVCVCACVCVRESPPPPYPLMTSQSPPNALPSPMPLPAHGCMTHEKHPYNVGRDAMFGTTTMAIRPYHHVHHSTALCHGDPPRAAMTTLTSFTDLF